MNITFRVWWLWTVTVLAVLLGVAATHRLNAEASSPPPPEIIPWDSVWVAHPYQPDSGQQLGTWVFFVTRDKYILEVWGLTSASKVDEVDYELGQIKEYLKAKIKKKGDK